MCVALASTASLLLPSPTKKYACRRLIYPHLALQCIYQQGGEPRAAQALSTHAEKCSDLETDSSFPVLLQGPGSDVPLPKKAGVQFHPKGL